MEIEAPLPALNAFMERRLSLVRDLAASLELSTLALTNNQAEAIARGAAHQAELCRQWSCLEDEARRRSLSVSHLDAPSSLATSRLAQMNSEWQELSGRIRYLTRVHCSLLRHLQRSLAILRRVIDSCGTTYTIEPLLASSIHESQKLDAGK